MLLTVYQAISATSSLMYVSDWIIRQCNSDSNLRSKDSDDAFIPCPLAPGKP